MLKVKDVMKHLLVSVPPGTSVAQAAKTMRMHRIGSLFIEQDQQIVGILTESDVARRVVCEDLDPASVSVDQAMSSPVIGVDELSSVTEAVDLMDRHGTRHLAVLRFGAVIGVLSVRDLLHPVSIDEF